MIGKMFRRMAILEDLVKSANTGAYTDDQIKWLLNQNILEVDAKNQKYKAKASYNDLTTGNRNRAFWTKVKFPGATRNILTKSQLDMLYVGYEDINDETSVEYNTSLEEHIGKSLNGTDNRALSSMPSSKSEVVALERMASGMNKSESNAFGDYKKDLAFAFAKNSTYTNVAILESLYRLSDRQDSETDKYFSIYIEGSGADMNILHKEGNNIAKFAGKIKDAVSLANNVEGLAAGTGSTGVHAKTKIAAQLLKQKIESYTIGNSNVKLNLIFELYGFSRGAATARIFAHYIDANRTNPKADLKRVSDKDCLDIAGFKYNFLSIKQNTSLKSKKISFIGIFDTVSSIGMFPHHDNVKKYGLYSTDQAEKVLHICALDELRMNFALTDIQSSIAEAKNGTEIFIPGCHTDIGGGAAIGREDAKIINKNDMAGVKVYLCAASPTKLEQIKYFPVDAEHLEELGWLESGCKTENDTITGRPSKEVLDQKEGTVFVDNGGKLTKRNNIVVYRYVTPGYSNIPLALMREGNVGSFEAIPPNYAVPKDLTDYYNGLLSKINSGGRVVAHPDEDFYKPLRLKYLHFSSNDQWLSGADNQLVNNAYSTVVRLRSAKSSQKLDNSDFKSIDRTIPKSMKEAFKGATNPDKLLAIGIDKALQAAEARSLARICSRVIYHGSESSASDSMTFMFDYNIDGEIVNCRNIKL